MTSSPTPTDGSGGINGRLSATTDTLYVPIGQSNPPQILALRLPKS